MKRYFIVILLIFNMICMYSQSEQWKEYCHLKIVAHNALVKRDYDQAAHIYLKMDSIYGKIVDYLDMRNFCITAANTGDTSLLKKTLITITGYKCFDISFLNDPIFNVYKKNDWWVVCDSLSQIYGHKNQQYIDTLRRLQIQDSIIRHQFAQAPDESTRDSALAIMRAIDSVNTIILSNLVRKYGLPTWENLGYKGFHSAYILMMHVKDTLQNSLIEQLLPLMEEGYLPRNRMAYLIDRQLIRKRLPIRYGCQVRRGGKSRPIEDIDNLNYRREEMWLEPRDIEKIKANIEEYE